MQLHMSMLKERDQFFSELQEIQRTSTPRPDWTKCEGEGSQRGPRSCLHVGPDSSSLSPHADVVAGGPERWQMLAEGKNSDQLVDVLLEEIGSGLLREKEFFPGLVGRPQEWGLGQSQNSHALLLRRAFGEPTGALPCLRVGPQMGPEMS